MIRTLLCALFPLFVAAATAQPRVRVERGPVGNSYDFILENKDRAGTLTLLLNFDRLDNCRNLTPGLHKFTVFRDNECFLTLKPEDESYGVGYLTTPAGATLTEDSTRSRTRHSSAGCPHRPCGPRA